MIFIGSGALLSQAVGYALQSGVKIDAIYCPIGDSSIPRIKNLNVPIWETDTPNSDLLSGLDNLTDNKIFSINNQCILEDRLLTSGPDFFNIHNGLVQRYRGIAEVCIFSAICKGEQKYGATLHQLLPGQKVDSGPVVAQLEFNVDTNDEFFAVMKQSLQTCQKIFEDNIESVISNSYQSSYVELLDTAYSYKDVSRICIETEPTRLTKAKNFGPYRSFFPRLVQLIEASR